MKLPVFLFVVFALFASTRGVEFSTVEIAGKRVTVCRVDVRKERLQLFHRDGNGQPFKRFPALADWLGQRGAIWERRLVLPVAGSPDALLNVPSFNLNRNFNPAVVEPRRRALGF